MSEESEEPDGMPAKGFFRRDLTPFVELISAILSATALPLALMAVVGVEASCTLAWVVLVASLFGILGAVEYFRRSHQNVWQPLLIVMGTLFLVLFLVDRNVSGDARCVPNWLSW